MTRVFLSALLVMFISSSLGGNFGKGTVCLPLKERWYILVKFIYRSLLNFNSVSRFIYLRPPNLSVPNTTVQSGRWWLSNCNLQQIKHCAFSENHCVIRHTWIRMRCQTNLHGRQFLRQSTVCNKYIIQ